MTNSLSPLKWACLKQCWTRETGALLNSSRYCASTSQIPANLGIHGQEDGTRQRHPSSRWPNWDRKCNSSRLHVSSPTGTLPSNHSHLRRSGMSAAGLQSPTLLLFLPTHNTTPAFCLNPECRQPTIL